MGEQSKAMGCGGAQGSLKTQHSHHTVDDIVGKFEVAISVGYCTMFQETSRGSALSGGYGVGLGLALGLRLGLEEGAASPELGSAPAGWPRRPAAASEGGREAAARARASGPLLRPLAEAGPASRARARRPLAALRRACAGAPLER